MKKQLMRIFAETASFTLLLAMLFAVSAGAKAPGRKSGNSFTVINNSGAAVFFKMYAADLNSCTQKYTSAPMTIEAHSQKSYRSQQEMSWMNATPQTTLHYLSLSCNCKSASGSCQSPASDLIGDEQCSFKKTAVIAKKCDMERTLNVTWTSNEGNVTVTIE
jgi:hypothetical protein